MMQQWADYLDRLKAGGDVIPCRSAHDLIGFCPLNGWKHRTRWMLKSPWRSRLSRRVGCNSTSSTSDSSCSNDRSDHRVCCNDAA